MFELVEIADYSGVVEFIFLNDRFIDDNFNPFGLDSLHDPLNGGGSEVVGATLHDQAIDTDHGWVLLDDAVGDKVAMTSFATLMR